MKLQRRLAVVAMTSMLASGLAIPAVHAADQKPQANNQVKASWMASRIPSLRYSLLGCLAHLCHRALRVMTLRVNLSKNI